MRFAGGSERILHAGFEISLIIKGLDGIFEIVGGMIFVFISPARLGAMVNFLTLHEISEDPKDIIANVLIRLSNDFSVSIQTFVIIYLIAHGLSKIVLVYLLQLKKLWAYPVSIGFLLLFIGYQIHRYMYGHSLFMVLLTVFDIAMIGFVLAEYRRVKVLAD